jgi:hypothetical protein
MGEARLYPGSDTSSGEMHCGPPPKEVKPVFRWNATIMKAAVAVAAFMALVVGSGADWRWN